MNENKIPDTIRFNWDIVKKYTNNNASKILEFFDNVYVRKTENYFYLNPWAAKIVKESKGDRKNYIQNVSDLVAVSHTATKDELFVYFDLCSLRSYFTFINTKGKVNYLPNWKIVERYDIDKLKMNRLLTFDDNNIYMLYEGENQ